MKFTPVTGALALALVATQPLLGLQALASGPFTPRDDNEVLERLPVGLNANQARAVRRQTEPQADEPPRLEEALRMAKSCIERSRAESDPRFLGYAQAALAPWWNSAQPPPEVLV